jgi:hypothetical protein
MPTKISKYYAKEKFIRSIGIKQLNQFRKFEDYVLCNFIIVASQNTMKSMHKGTKMPKVQSYFKEEISASESVYSVLTIFLWGCKMLTRVNKSLSSFTPANATKYP